MIIWIGHQFLIFFFSFVIHVSFLAKYVNHKGRSRHFTSPEELEEQRKKKELAYVFRFSTKIEHFSHHFEKLSFLIKWFIKMRKDCLKPNNVIFCFFFGNELVVRNRNPQKRKRTAMKTVLRTVMIMKMHIKRRVCRVLSKLKIQIVPWRKWQKKWPK